ncbi:alpha/beta fold hydrolase [Rhodococcus erythropolis]|uniref:alpha/beta fold hydrolase n=1 Tax=Rhodococcus erythropolis TaxID=1833 RepID=UPI0027E28E96|nr:alpha/beta hydrolase [Rhodococcus erythropolis]
MSSSRAGLHCRAGKFLAVQGAEIHYHDIGSGPNLVMLQAFGPLPGTTAWFTFERILSSLSKFFRCILIDNPNFGISSPVLFNEPIHDMYVRQALAVMDHEGIETASVLGTSTGGTVALDLALTAPQRVERLVVGSCEFSTGGDPYLMSAFPTEGFRLFYDALTMPPDRSNVRRLLRSFVHDEELITDDLIDAMHDWRVDEPQHAQSWLASTSLPSNHASDLRVVSMPTLIIHGQQDRMVPVEQSLRMLTLLPNADLSILGRCGHWPTIERPDEYARQALDFLQRP